MADTDNADSQQSETAVDATLKNDGSSTTTTTESSVSADEQLRLERQEAMRTKQELNLVRKKADDLARELEQKTKKELEEKEDYRSLAERAQAEAAALRKEKEEAESKATTENVTKDVYKDFPENVQKVATTVGLTAQSDSEEARTALKAKLEALQKDIGGSAPSIQGSNPAPTTNPNDNFDPVRAGKLMRVDDRSLRDPAIKEAVGRHPQVAAFREFAKQQNNVQPQTS